jgi:hypothetical protein
MISCSPGVLAQILWIGSNSSGPMVGTWESVGGCGYWNADPRSTRSLGWYPQNSVLVLKASSDGLLVNGDVPVGDILWRYSMGILLGIFCCWDIIGGYNREIIWATIAVAARDPCWLHSVYHSWLVLWKIYSCPSNLHLVGMIILNDDE